MQPMRRVLAGAAGLTLVAAVAAGCGAAQAEPGWGPFANRGLEVDAPASFDDLQREATVVVLAHAVDVTEVPSPDAGLSPDLGVMALTLEVDEVVRGEAGERITVVRPLWPLDDVDQLCEALPSEQVLVFARPAGYGGHLTLTSGLGMIAERDGALVAVLDEPLTSLVVPAGAASMEQLVEAVRHA